MVVCLNCRGPHRKRDCWSAWKNKAEALTAERDAIKAALVRYGVHDGGRGEGADRDCVYIVSQGDLECDCGLEVALPARLLLGEVG